MPSVGDSVVENESHKIRSGGPGSRIAGTMGEYRDNDHLGYMYWDHIRSHDVQGLKDLSCVSSTFFGITNVFSCSFAVSVAALLVLCQGKASAWDFTDLSPPS